MQKAFLNGEFVKFADAKISIFDRGFLFGDSVYEVLPVYNNRLFFLDRHLNRLLSNLKKTKIDIPTYDWNEVLNTLLANQGEKKQHLYIQISRGDQGERKHDIPASITPTVIAFSLNSSSPTLAEKELGVHAKLLDDYRWTRCDIKTTSLMANILLMDEAVSAGFQTSILVRDNKITEGSASNIFIVDANGHIKTPPLNGLCLPGITREVTIELIQKLKWHFSQEAFSTQELFAAQEVWMTSTTKGIYPITRIDDSVVGSGKAGEYWRTIEASFQNLIS